MPKNCFFWLALFWTGVIAWLCLVNFNELPEIKIGFEDTDKYVHAGVHFIFTVIWYSYLKSRNSENVVSNLGKVVTASFLYGVLIEIAQGVMTITRHADARDVAANLTGALIVAVVILLTARLRRTN